LILKTMTTHFTTSLNSALRPTADVSPSGN
jgi:hypothetical protein